MRRVVIMGAGGRDFHESRHTGGLEARPREYEERVVGFLDHALLARG